MGGDDQGILYIGRGSAVAKMDKGGEIGVVGGAGQLEWRCYRG